MTQPAQTPIQRFLGDTFTVSFPVTTFGAAASSEIEVSLNGELQTLGVDYVVNLLTPSGFTLVFFTAPLLDVIVSARRATALFQATDYLENDPFPAETHESALDKLTRLTQDLFERLLSIPRFRVDKAPTSLDYPGPNQFLRMASDGKSITGVTTIPTAGAFVPNSAVQALQDSGALPAESVALFHDDGNPATHIPHGNLARALGLIAVGPNDLGKIIRILGQNTVELVSRGALPLSASLLLDATHNDATLGVSASGAARIITLPSLAGITFHYRVTVTKTDSSANTVTIDTNDAALIEGAASVALLDQHNGITFIRSDDGLSWRTVRFIGGAGGAASPTTLQVFTGSGTWTKNSGSRRALIFAIGAGGGGGGAAAAGSGSAAAGGGGAGSLAISFLDVSAIANAAITIGAAGAAGAAGNNAGGTGGDTVWADGTTTITAKGGVGGAGGPASAASLGKGGNGGITPVATGGLINGQGEAGHTGVRDPSIAISGRGGASFVAGGGPELIFDTNPSGGAGNPGTGYGSGGSGGANFGSAVARAGSTGAPGILFVLEFI